MDIENSALVGKVFYLNSNHARDDPYKKVFDRYRYVQMPRPSGDWLRELDQTPKVFTTSLGE
jgi:hypothetical protein